MTILELAEEYKEADCARFHTPGHKGNFEPLNRLALSGLDITELVGMGSLYEGNGPITQTEQLFEQLYGSRKTLLSAGGCTLCIQAMLAVSNLSGKRLLAGRNSHVCLFHTAALLGIELLFTEAFGGAPSPESVRSALSQDRGIAAVYLTSVGYLGEQADVSGVAAVCREYGVPLLVDNAHGAHLKWMEGQIHPLDAGASLCCDSIHKSLPAMTGAALLHIGGEQFAERAREKMALFGSTSPSYPVMISAQLCAEYLLSGECGEDFLRLSHRMEKIRSIAREKGILYEAGTEPTKLTIRTFGEDLYAHFRHYGVEPEYVSREYMVFWASPMNSDRDFDRLEEAVQSLPPATFRSQPIRQAFPIPQQVLSVRQATFADSEEIGIDSAVGRVAGDTVSACPPGWVFAVPGEQMTEETVRRIKAQGIQTVRVVKDSQTAFDR